MVDGALLEEFAARGIVRLDGVFDAGDATAMREVVCREWYERDGIAADDPATWPAGGGWQKTLPKAKRSGVFRRVLGPPLTSLADALLGPGWRVSKGMGNLLVSLPDTTEWVLPASSGHWHSDYGYGTPMDPLPALRVFAVFGEMPPGGGGTLLVAGSHRMVERFLVDRPRMAAAQARQARPVCHASNPWLAELTGGDERAERRIERFVHSVTDVDGIPAQVVEACGEPGTVFVCHPWTIHCRPPHAGTLPRFLRSPTLAR